MHKTTFFALILAFLASLTLTVAQAQCGPNVGSCTDGNCCSSSGFCGMTPSHCGTGCQVGFGSCGDAGSSSSAVVLPSSGIVTPTGSIVTSDSTVLPTPTSTDIVTPSPTGVTATTTTTTTTTTESRTSTSARGTYQLQPTGKPNNSAPQDKGVRSTLALVVVLLAGFLMI
ncbi:hypothetical protein BGZ94_008717 [Podila epigama]|nr:hypothetical protein BGZ94_008717 [Podila epigama]